MKTVVLAKRYTEAVSNAAVQEVVASKAHYGCQHAIVVTNSTFTASARELAASNGVALWDRQKLDDLIRMYL